MQKDIINNSLEYFVGKCYILYNRQLQILNLNYSVYLN